ncbi:hypothetical protein ACQ4PT_003541 [Festuca glaucescens]
MDGGPPAGMDDSPFLGSMMGDTVLAQPAAAPPPPAPYQQLLQTAPPPKKRRGRPPRNQVGPPAAAARRKEEDEEEVVCFICFDGGDLVVCDRRGCPKVYHPACVKRDEAFFQGRSKWNCGWHICSSCEKAAVHYMCYTCTFSVCKVCIKHGKFFSVRGNKGFCDTCYGTIVLVEAKDEGGDTTKVKVDFDDRLSWEYLFKLYWLDLKGKLSLTMEELTDAKSRWNAPITYARKEKDESSDDLYDANYDEGAGSDCSPGKRKRANASRKKGQRRRKAHSVCNVTVENAEIATGNAESLPKKEPSEGVPLDSKWASPELLEFVGHMRDGDQSFISQFDVQAILLEYVKKNDLRNPRRKSQIICDSRLHRLFRKTHVAHFEMLRLLEMHFLASDASTVNNGNHETINVNSAQIDDSGYGEITDKPCPGRKKRMHRKIEREPLGNLKDYAAIDMHNINLIYLRRSLMEDLLDDPTFSDKISGGFVRIKITDVGQKQHMYRLVKVVVEQNENGKRSKGFSPIKVQNFAKKMADAIRHPKNLSKQSTSQKLGAVRNSKNFHSTNGMDIPKSGTNISSRISEAAPLSSSPVKLSSDIEPEKVWHYKDPSGNVQGPFTLLQLSKWTAYFPRDLRVWLIFESEERSLLLTEVLSKQPKDFGQAASVRSSKTTLAGSAQHRNSSNVDMNSTLSPVGYNMSSIPERGSAHASDGRFSLKTSSVPAKVADNDNCRIQQHAKYSGFVSSSGSLHAQPDLKHDGVQRRCSAEWNNGHSRGDLWSPSTTQASCSGQNSVESHNNHHASRSLVQHDSKSSLQEGSLKDLDLRQEHSRTIPTQLARRDVPSPVLALSPSESRTASSQYESSCLSSTNPSLHDELHSSITSEKAKSCAPATSVEDRGSSSPSGMLTHSERVPAISETCKVGEIKNEQKICEADASNASVNQSPQSKMFPDSSPDNQDIEGEYPSATQKSESKKSMDQSGSTSLPLEILDAKIPDQLPVDIVSQKSDLPTDEKRATDSVSNPQKADLSGEDSPTKKECYSEPILAPMEKSVADPASCPESIDAPDVPKLVSGPPTEEMGVTDPVPNIEKADLSGEDSNTQKERYSEATLLTREKLIADPVSCAETINVSDVPESVSNLEKRDSKGQDSSIQKELYKESGLVASEKTVADLASCAKSDLSHVPGSDFKGEDSNIQEELYSKAALVTTEKMVAEPTSCSKSIDVSNVLQSVSNLERRDLKDEDSVIQKELFSESTPVTSEKMVVEPVSWSESIDVSDVLQSVSNLERRNLKDKDSVIQKELFSESTLVTSEKLVVDPAPCAESIDVSDVLDSVFNLERAGLKGEHSNIHKELREESTTVTRENIVIEPPSCESVHVSGVVGSVFNLNKTYLEGEGSDIQKELHEGSTLVTRESVVPDALESLIERNRGTLCMDAIAAIEEFMTTSPGEEPQCSSPIALSPWGESGYYQGDAVDSGLWGVQDDPINDMWSLLSPTPAPQHLSGAKSDGSGIHGINAVAATQGEIDFFQRGPTPGEYWGLTEQEKPKATAAPVSSSVDLNTGLFGWQPSASERPIMEAAWSTSQNPNLYYNYQTAASVRTSQEASVKREVFTEFDAANSGGALGNNTKSWNASTGNANRGSQRRDRYSQISESWLLSSNNSRSRSDALGGGGTSRTAPRGACKFHENGYCRKGSSCNYLHR